MRTALVVKMAGGLDEQSEDSTRSTERGSQMLSVAPREVVV